MDKESFDVVVSLSKIATPIIVALIGFLLLRAAEHIKRNVNKEHDFLTKWADEYFEVLKELHTYSNELVENIYALHFQCVNNQQNSEESKIIQNNINALALRSFSLESKIKSYGAFTEPKIEKELLDEASKLFSIAKGIVNNAGTFGKGFSFDTQELTDLVRRINKFSNKAHASVLFNNA